MKISVPSLKIWGISILAFLLFQGLLFYKMENNLIDPAVLAYWEAQFQVSWKALENDFKNSSPETYKIALIGSSLVGHGIQCPDEIRTYALKRHQKAIQLNKIFLIRLPFAFLVKRKLLLKKLAELKPDLVCIQNEMLIRGLHQKDEPSLEGALPSVVTETYQKLVEMNKWFWVALFNKKPNIGRNKHYNSCLMPKKEFVQIDTNYFTPLKRKLRRFESLGYAHSGLQQLNELGIKTVIIELPKPPFAPEAIYSEHDETSFQNILKQYKKSFNIDYWDYERGVFYFKHFGDFAHLNEDGQKLYSEWLIDKIVEEMPE